MATPDKDLAVVIPVWNLPDDIRSLLGQIETLGIFSEVIVSDDASDPPCDPAGFGITSETLGARLLYLRSEVQRGAGHARNLGLREVTAANVIFFDADDRLEPGLASIFERHLQGIEGVGVADFTIFRHQDSRVVEKEGRAGSFMGDEKLWDRAIGKKRESPLNLEARAHLSPVSAYPWNKIYRTDFLRESGIDCSETPVHNDVKLHWQSFAKAKNVLALREIGATHVVGDRGHHLTTRPGEDRFCIFDIIKGLIAEIRDLDGNMILMRHFIHFVHNVCQWNLGFMEPALRPAFAARTCETYLAFSPEEFTIYALWQPEKAGEIMNFMIREGA